MLVLPGRRSASEASNRPDGCETGYEVIHGIPGGHVRELSETEISDLIVGAAILGCGGGGPLADGLADLRRVHEAGLAVVLAAPDEVQPDALVACPYAVGSMTTTDHGAEDRDITDHPAARVIRALAEHVGRPPGALVCGELGATSMADACVPAAVLGVPVIDADPVGRAVPEIVHSQFALHGLPIAPMALASEDGEATVIESVVDDAEAEVLVRATSDESGGAIWVADHALPWRDLRDASIHGTLTLSERVGAARREAVELGNDPVEALAAAGGGRVAFRGTVTSLEWREEEGFAVGEIELASTEHDEHYRVWFKNENLITWLGDEPDITCPDLIAVVDATTGIPQTNPLASAGASVAVVGFPCAPQWKTEEGIALLGPRYFGSDVDFRPLVR